MSNGSRAESNGGQTVSQTVSLNNFFTLTPDRVLDSVESALQGFYPGVRATGRSFTLNSMENRVYEIELEDQPSVVVKFFRPNRWTPEQIAEEHAFVEKLAELEIPTVVPLRLKPSAHALSTARETVLRTTDGLCFAIYPKIKGRIRDELTDEELRMVGRLLGRMHNIGEKWKPLHRESMTLERMIDRPMHSLRQSKLVPENFWARYEQVVASIRARADERLRGIPRISVHGDCHLGNTLWGPDGPFFLDFDDFTVAPSVQDIWLVVRGRDDDARRARDVLLSGYALMREPPRQELALIETLRALRMIHYSGWIAQRWEDPIFQKTFTRFTDPAYWQEEIEALMETLQDSDGPVWN